MKKLAVIDSLRSLQVSLQLAVLLFLICGQVWGAADTLLPVADNINLWDVYGCTDHYDCVDDPPGDPDGDITRITVTVVAKSENYQLETASMSGTIDSLQIRVCGKKDGTPADMQVGFVHWTEFWQWHIEGSIDFTGDYADYSILSTEDENAFAWTNAKINARRFGVYSGEGNMFWYFRVTQIFVIVYYAEEAVGKPSEPIIREDEDAKGICKGRIVR